MATTRQSSFNCPINAITHVIIDTGYGAKLNAHIREIEQAIEYSCGATYECLFTYGHDNMPHMFVPNANAQKVVEAERIAETVRADSLYGPICFIAKSGGGIATFIIIDIISEMVRDIITFDCVTTLRYIHDGVDKILLVSYDTSASVTRA